MRIIERPLYLNRIISQLNRNMMIVLVGQRRTGKSYLLRSLRDWIEQNRPNSNVIYINKEEQDNDDIQNSKDLHDYAMTRFAEGGDNYLLIDEVQDIEEYEKALRSLYAKELCQIVVTGSNAYVFSSDLAKKLSGRYIEIFVGALGYKEFLRFHGLADDHASLGKYLKFGGMPGLVNYELDEVYEIKGYLQGIYNTVVLKDVIEREEIRNVEFLGKLVRYIADNTGQLVSSNSIVKYHKAHGEKLSYDLVSRYEEALCNSYLISSVPRYDIHGKSIFERIDKYYFADHGIRNYLAAQLPNIFGSIEKVIENVIYNHLLIHGFDVKVGVLASGEVDFVATRDQETMYVQSCYRLTSHETIEREFGRLKAIGDNYPKYVVSMEDFVGPLPEYPGISHIHLREFLNMFG